MTKFVVKAQPQIRLFRISKERLRGKVSVISSDLNWHTSLSKPSLRSNSRLTEPTGAKFALVAKFGAFCNSKFPETCLAYKLLALPICNCWIDDDRPLGGLVVTLLLLLFMLLGVKLELLRPTVVKLVVEDLLRGVPLSILKSMNL